MEDRGSDGWRPQLDPGTGRAFTRVLDLTPTAIEAHLKGIRAEYDAKATLSLEARADLLGRLADLVDAAAFDLGELDALCTGKRLADSVATARLGAATLRYYAGLLEDDPFSETPEPIEEGVRQVVDRVAVGLVACLLPWNFLLSQACARLAMLFASGNAGIFKGSDLAQPPLLALEELAREAGMPSWAFSVVTGGSDAGRMLTEAPPIDAICFTGEVATGIAVARSAMGSLKRIVLELGGKTPFVVFADADREAALDASLNAGFAFQGQACHAGSQLLVEAPIFDEFLERFAAGAAALELGHQLAEPTEIGPLISADQCRRVHEMVEAAVHAGARLHTGGQMVDDLGGYYYRPAVLSEVPSSTAIATEEVFGPIVTAHPFEREAEIVERVNASPYGLAATIWTGDAERAERLRRFLRTGQLYVNSHGLTPVNVPWGGFRLSGLGRLYGKDGLYAFTEARSTYEAPPSPG